MHAQTLYTQVRVEKPLAQHAGPPSGEVDAARVPGTDGMILSKWSRIVDMNARLRELNEAVYGDKDVCSEADEGREEVC